MTPLRKLRETVLARVRALPVAQHLWARVRKRRYEAHVARFLQDGSGRADRLPPGIVYEATMRCNLHCEFCYVGDLLNIEGQWRDELAIDALRTAFPERDGLQVNLTGGEIFMRKDILSVLALFEEKGYDCGCLTTNGTIITEARAEALAELALRGFLKHISVSIDGPRDLHDVARGQKGTFDKTTAGIRRLREAAERKGAPLRISINTTVGEGEPRDARSDGGRRQRARDRGHRPQSPDVQHAGRGERDAGPHRERRPGRDRDVRHGRSDGRASTGPREGRFAP